MCIKRGIVDKGAIHSFLHDSLIFKLLPDLNKNNEEMEVFSTKLINKKSKKILISTQCRHPSSKGKISEEYFEIFFTKPKQLNQPLLPVT